MLRSRRHDRHYFVSQTDGSFPVSFGIPAIDTAFSQKWRELLNGLRLDGSRRSLDEMNIDANLGLMRIFNECYELLHRTDQAHAALGMWESILPARIASEDLGDYIEDINRRVARGERVLPWIRVVAAIFWTGVNAVGYLMRNMLGREKTGA